MPHWRRFRKNRTASPAAIVVNAAAPSTFRVDPAAARSGNLLASVDAAISPVGRTIPLSSVMVFGRR